MEGQRFDGFARMLGRSNSRRDFVKVLGVGLAGALFGAFGSDRAVADTGSPGTGGNSDCAHWCHDHFQGSAAGQCTSAAALGGGVCFACGPAAPASHPDLCQGSCCPAAAPNCCGATCVSVQTDVKNCGACGAACPSGSACCGGICTSLTTVINCGACGHICPGYQEPNDNVTCNGSGQCTFSCQGENYDVDNDPSDGCERLHTPAGNHVQSSAVSEGSHTCLDTDTFSFSGVLLSDSRVHESPSIVGFDSTVGSAPDWYQISATGNPSPLGFCSNDLDITIATAGGSSSGQCYKLTVITDRVTYSVPVSGNGTASISQTAAQYSDGSTIYLEVQKTCSLPVQEAITYTISGHL